MSILPAPSPESGDPHQPQPAAIASPQPSTLNAQPESEGLPTFHPQCKIYDIKKLAARDAELRKQGLFVEADSLRALVARALCYPHPLPAHLLGGVA
jgi:hypothetical protein